MTVATVRALVPDRVQYDRTTAQGDGSTLEYKLPNCPVVAGTVKVYLDGSLQGAGYSVEASLGLVTFDVAPAEGTAIVITYQHTLLSDADLQAFLTAEGDVDKRAAALALETIASDQALTLKVLKLMDLTTDGARVSDALLKRAAALREQADREEAGEEGGSLDWAEMVTDDFSYRERLWNEGLRS